MTLATSLGFLFLPLLLLRSRLYLWVHRPSSCTFPSYISGVHHPSSFAFSAIPALSLGFFFYEPGSAVHHSSSAIPAISLGFTNLLLLLRSRLYLLGSPFFFFFCVPCYIFGVHHSSSSSSSSSFFFFFFFYDPGCISGFIILSEIIAYVTVFNFLKIQPLR